MIMPQVSSSLFVFLQNNEHSSHSTKCHKNILVFGGNKPCHIWEVMFKSYTYYYRISYIQDYIICQWKDTYETNNNTGTKESTVYVSTPSKFYLYQFLGYNRSRITRTDIFFWGEGVKHLKKIRIKYVYNP